MDRCCFFVPIIFSKLDGGIWGTAEKGPQKVMHTGFIFDQNVSVNGVGLVKRMHDIEKNREKSAYSHEFDNAFLCEYTSNQKGAHGF